MMKTKVTFGSGMDELQQRMGASMIGAVASTVPASIAHEAVVFMEMDLLRQGWPVGQALGALPEVQKRLGLGRPASREAITILEARGLLDVRRGPGGGLFVAVPPLEDVAGSILMYLALAGQTHACIQEFRLVVWRMIVKTAIQQRVSLHACAATPGEWGFAVNLAEHAGNRTMGLLARLAEMLVRISQGQDAPVRDRALEAAIQEGNQVRAFERLDEIVGSTERNAPVIAFEVAEHGFSLSGRKSAMALAARMARELSGPPRAQEAEWETAQRLGYTESVVRQARRILQDFGVLRCRQGRKGAEFAPPTAPTGVIRMLAPCLVASATRAKDTRDAIYFLVGSASILAANRVEAVASASISFMASLPKSDPVEALTLENRLLELSGNPLLAIVVRSLGLANTFIAKDMLIPPHMSDIITFNRRILRAIEAGDAATASALAQAKFDLMQWPTDGFRNVA